MNHTLWMNDDFDTFRWHVEQPMRFDYFQPFVHQGCRIDGNLASHDPIWMRARLRRSDSLQKVLFRIPKGPPRRRQQNPSYATF